ncbi:lysozyme inhibitor LprI family protein [Kiloniella litopenaei]|uniref:lysozyme inhibitor LprI family protein n=1 Tax=Kiloniella litopenaei TaxID=1549748 RepID=UPI003BACB484
MYLKFLSFISVLSVVFIPGFVWAEADGPDFFRVKSSEAPIRVEAHAESSVVAVFTNGTVGLKNLGCTGVLSYEDWLKLSDDEKKTAKENVWCKVSFLQHKETAQVGADLYSGVTGWVQNILLQEYGVPSGPTFKCEKVTSEVEKLICSDRDLMFLDHTLNGVYNASLDAVNELPSQRQQAAKSKLMALQRGWIKGRNDCWKEQEEIKACVQDSYLHRIVRLQAEWGLTTVDKPATRFTCDGNDRNEFYATELDLILPVVIVERGDSRDILVKAYAVTEGQDRLFSGAFGNQLAFFDDTVTLRWRNETLNCRTASSD